MAAVREALALAGCDPARVRLLASADIKADEAGLHEAARQLGLPLRLVGRRKSGTRCRHSSIRDLVQKR